MGTDLNDANPNAEKLAVTITNSDFSTSVDVAISAYNS